jgi:hypothetical protein
MLHIDDNFGSISVDSNLIMQLLIKRSVSGRYQRKKREYLKKNTVRQLFLCLKTLMIQ